MKLKERMNRQIEVLLMLLLVVAISRIPFEMVSIIAAVLFGVLGAAILLLLVVLCWQRRKAVMLMVLLSGLFSVPAFARDAADCENETKDKDEYHICVYDVYRSNYGSELCNYVKKFKKSTKARKGREEDEMIENVENAKLLDAAFDALPDSQKQLVNCSRDPSAPPNPDAKDDVVCCAREMIDAYARYTAKNPPRGIESVMALLAKPNMQCWPCDVVFLLVTVINSISFRMAPFMAERALVFLEYGFFVWIFYHVFLLIIGKEKGGDFFNGFLKVFLLVMLAAFIMTDVSKQSMQNRIRGTHLDSFYEYVVNPPFEMIAGAGVKWSKEISKNSLGFMGRLFQELRDTGQTAWISKINMYDYCASSTAVERREVYRYITNNKVRVSYKLDTAARGSGSLISIGLESGMLCMTQMAFNTVAPLAAIGSLLVTDAVQRAKPIVDTWLIKFGPRIPPMPQWIYGGILQLVAWLFGVVIAFQLIDICLRLAYVLLLSPVLLTAAVFPETREYGKHGVTCLFNAIMGFLQITLALALTLPLMYGAVIGDKNHEMQLFKNIVAKYSDKYVSNIYDVLTDGGARFFILLTLSCFFSFCIFKSAKSMFGSIFGIAGGASLMNLSSQDVRAKIGEAATETGKVTKSSKAVAGKLGNKLANTRAGLYVGKKMNSAKAAVKNSYVGRAVGGTVNAVKSGVKAVTDNKVGRLIGGAAKAAGGSAMHVAGNAVRKFFYMDPKSRKKYDDAQKKKDK